MHEPKSRATFGAGEGPGDDGLEWCAVSDIRLVPTFPGVAEPLVWYYLQHLAVNDPVPRAARRRLEGELLAFHWLETDRRHEPAADQRAIRQRLPDRLTCMRGDFIEHDC